MIPAHEEIPTHVIDAALTLKNHAIMHGWGGPTGDGPWSVHGIGSVKAHQQRLRELDAEREDHVKATAQLADFQKSFSGHVYVRNEDYATLCRNLRTCREALDSITHDMGASPNIHTLCGRTLEATKL